MRLLLLLFVAGAASAQSLSIIQTVYDGDSLAGETVDGLNFAWTSAVSPDGGNVYVCSGVANIASAGEDDNAISVFSRQDTTGELTFVEALFDNQDGGVADGLFSCRDVAVSPDGKNVYTAGSSDHRLGIFNRNLVDGSLAFQGAVVDGSGGVDGLSGARAIAISPDGSVLFVAARADDAVSAFSRGSATGALTFESLARNGLVGVTGLDRPLALALSPDGRHVYAASGSNVNFTGSDALTVFQWDAGLMQLNFVAVYAEGAAQGPNIIDGLDQVTDVAVSPDGRHVYAVSEVDTISGASGNGNDWIALFERDAGTGQLTWLGAIAGFRICPTSPFGGDAESFVEISADGRRVYVTHSWANNGVAMFSRDLLTGNLTFLDGICELDPEPIGINLPRGMSLDPRGAHLYVAGNASDAVAVFDTGLLADGFEGSL